jgi:surfactin family lipopeptide synthetase A/lichenysin synthetase A
MRAMNEPFHSPDLKFVFTGGEVLYKEDVQRFIEIFPAGCGLVYNFGSTEAGVISHIQIDLENARKGKFQQSYDDPVFPSGSAQNDTELLLLDNDGKPMPPPAEGELAVRSRFLSSGYWNDPALTDKYFPAELATENGSVYRTGDIVRIRPDGSILYLGRRDSQIKVRGYRINLNEVEGALRSIEGIVAAAARGVENQEGKTQIVAYIQRKESCRLSAAELRRTVTDILPGYMVPAIFMDVDHLPVTAGGKLDRMALPLPERLEPADQQRNFQEPATITEQILCTLLSELLNNPCISATDDIFELGSDSMTVFQLIPRIKNNLQADVDPQTIFALPLIRDLAQKIDQLRSRN